MSVTRATFFLTALFLVIGATSSKGQVNLGMRMGVNSAAAAIHLSYGDSYYTGARAGLIAGIAMEFGLFGPVSVQFEPQYAQKGYKLQEDYLGNPLTVVGKLDYVEMPVLLKGTWRIGRVRAYAFCGPNPGFRSSAQVAQMFPDSTEISSVNYSVKDFDLALDAGVGLGFLVNPTTTFVADVRYSHGLVNVDNGHRGNDYRSRDLKVMLGMMFEL